MYESAVATGLGGALELLLEPHPATSTAAATIARIRARRTAERLLRRRGAWRASGDRLGPHVVHEARAARSELAPPAVEAEHGQRPGRELLADLCTVRPVAVGTAGIGQSQSDDLHRGVVADHHHRLDVV